MHTCTYNTHTNPHTAKPAAHSFAEFRVGLYSARSENRRTGLCDEREIFPRTVAAVISLMRDDLFFFLIFHCRLSHCCGLCANITHCNLCRRTIAYGITRKRVKRHGGVTSSFLRYVFDRLVFRRRIIEE